MQSLFDYPRRALLALAVFLIATIFYSSWKLTFVATTGSMAALVMACTFLLLVLVVAGLGHVVAVLKPLLEARTGSGAGCATNVSRGSTHRQQLEMGVVSTMLMQAGDLNDGVRAGRRARAALDALTGAGEQKAGLCTCAAAPGAACAQCPRNPEDTKKLAAALKAAAPHSIARVTPADIEANISAEYSFTLDKALAGCPLVDGLDRVTLAVVVLRNGTKLVGVNYGAVDPARHDAEQGRVEARAAAVEQVWPLMGYELRTKLAA